MVVVLSTVTLLLLFINIIMRVMLCCYEQRDDTCHILGFLYWEVAKVSPTSQKRAHSPPSWKNPARRLPHQIFIPPPKVNSPHD